MSELQEVDLVLSSFFLIFYFLSQVIFLFSIFST